MAEKKGMAPPANLTGISRPGRGGVVVKPKNMKGTLTRLWQLTRGQRGGLGWILLLSALASGASILSPYATGAAVTAISQGDAVTWILCCLTGLYVCDWLVKFLQAFFMASIGQRIIHHIRKTLFAHIRTLPLAFFDRHQHGELMSRLTNDVDNISTTISNSLTLLLTYGFTIAGIFCAMVALSPLLTLVSLCGVLLIQSDLGALLIYFLTTVAMFYVATSRLGLSLAGLGAGAACAVIAYKTMPYVQRRLQSFLDPWSDPMETGYQIVQALIAIGSGGLFGMGLGLGMPRNIPLYHSDFIFAAICEEFGLIFAVCLLIVYALIFMRALTIAMNARTSFHSLVAFGIAFMFALQALIIVGGNIRLIPLTGVTLPLVSAGGSSIVGTMASLGLLIGISSLNAEAEAVDLRRMEWREGGGL